MPYLGEPGQGIFMRAIEQEDAMDKQTYERGLEIRKSVLGKEFVEKSIASADDFNRPLQELVTEYCWGAVWGSRWPRQEDPQHHQPGDD
jgi:hypothetical protein